MPPTADSTEPAVQAVPDYALKHAPIVWLHKSDEFFPSHPVEHLQHVTPRTFAGVDVDVPADVKHKVKLLAHPTVNKGDVFLTLDKDIRENPKIPELQTSHCKPDSNGRSHSPCFIIVGEKSALTPACVDVFYFLFYAFNEGNTVLFQHFGNHVGDWEHCMIRYINGVPTSVHLSAHSDGNAWDWKLLEKDGERPVIYSAGGSHAMYPKAGTHNYSGVFLVGPQDHTSKGFRWDPTLNFCVASIKDWHFAALTSTHQGHNKEVSVEDVVTILSYEGRWGNSFSEIRHRKSHLQPLKDFGAKIMAKVTNTDDDELEKAEAAAINGEGQAVVQKAKKDGIESLSLNQKLLLLIYAEGPTGPRDKSLDRKTMNRWENRAVLLAL